MYREEDYLMLSGIQHFCFCRRQWALIHIEQQWEENYRTTAGELFHKRAHDETAIEKRGDTLIIRGLHIASPQLGLSGQCDVVEFHQKPDGIRLRNYDGLWSVFPIEYEAGKPKEGQEDLLQLCAQAICLEEMFLTEIEEGCLFYGETKHREKVKFTPELRQQVEEMSLEMHQLFGRGYTPKVKTSSKCRACSLNEVCLPKLQKTGRVADYMAGMLHSEEEAQVKV